MGVSENICVYIAIGGRNNMMSCTRLYVPAEICVYIAIRRVRMRAVGRSQSISLLLQYFHVDGPCPNPNAAHPNSEPEFRR